MPGRFPTWLALAIALLAGACDQEGPHPCQDQLCPSGQVCNAEGSACQAATPRAGGDELAGVGGWPSLAVAPDGRLWFAAYDAELGALAVGTWAEPRGFHYEHAAGAGLSPTESDLGLHPSLCLDAEGRAHVAHHDAATGGVLHTWADGARWQTEIVEPGLGGLGLAISLRCGEGDSLHLAYYDPRLGQTRYARREGGTWQRETVPLEGEGPLDYGAHLSLGLREGEPVLAVYERLGGDLYLLSREAGRWRQSLLAGRDETSGRDTGDAGRHVSLDVDEGGRLSLAFHEATTGSLLYARSAGGVLVLETVDDGRRSGRAARDFVGQGARLGRDARGRPSVVYLDATRLETWEARRDFDGSWRRRRVADCEGVALGYAQALVSDRHVLVCSLAEGASLILRLTSLDEEGALP